MRFMLMKILSLMKAMTLTRSKGPVTGVKKQLKSDCWAFAAAATAESNYKIGGGSLTSLSMQQIVDCSGAGSARSGGDPGKALSYCCSKGLESLSAYPYKGGDYSCSYSSSKATYKFSTSGGVSGESSMASKLQSHVIAIGLDASALSHYSGGVLSDCNHRSLNHAVTLVGKGTQSGKSVWIIKNSWGTSWGDRGYLIMPYGVGCLGLSRGWYIYK